LHLGKPPVRPERLVKPAKTLGMLPIVDSIVTLPVVFKTPCATPGLLVVRGNHSAFSACSHDFVLTERESSSISHRSDRSPLVSRALDCAQSSITLSLCSRASCRMGSRSQASREVYSNDGSSARRNRRTDGICGDILRNSIHVGNYGTRATHHSARS